MDYSKLCINCMQEKRDVNEACPYCGFDPKRYRLPAYALEPFTILHGRYLLGKMLGAGGFGITYLAIDLPLDRKIVIKEFFMRSSMHRDSTSSSQIIVSGADEASARMFRIQKDKFENEAKTLAKLEQLPGIVDVRDFFDENGTSYMALEYLEGLTLKDYMKSRGGRLPIEEVLAKMKPAMESLAQLHSLGILHRDISPDNIMVLRDGTVKLFDFGGARVQFPRERHHSQVIMMKAGYTPVEQYMNAQQGPWTDVYAMAATLYHAVTGVRPPEAITRSADRDPLKSFAEVGVNIDSRYERAIQKGLAVRAENRYRDIPELMDALYGKDERGARERESRKEEGKKERRGFPVFAIAAIAAAGVLAAGLLAFFLLGRGPVTRDISLASVAVASEGYTGGPIEPEVTVTLRGRKLKQDVDYTLEYFDNIEAGTGTVTVTGIGQCTSNTRATFSISRAQIEDAAVTVEDPVYNGSRQSPEPTVELDGVVLVQDRDYNVRYTGSSVNAGPAEVRITGIGNYQGETSAAYHILPADLSGAALSVQDQTYTGQPCTPAVTVKHEGALLFDTEDYSVTYSNNTDVGTAGVTVTGTGNYTGTAKSSFLITQAPEPAAVPTLDPAAVPTPAPTPYLEPTLTIYCGLEVPQSQFNFPDNSYRNYSKSEFDVLFAGNARERYYKSQIFINEIFIRYGYDFSEKIMTPGRDTYMNYIQSDWYPRAIASCPSSDMSVLMEQYMNSTERYNIRLVNEWQTERGIEPY